MFHALFLTSINKLHPLKNTGFISARVSLCLQKYDIFLKICHALRVVSCVCFMRRLIFDPVEIRCQTVKYFHISAV